jgi:acetoin utilization protein AcuB
MTKSSAPPVNQFPAVRQYMTQTPQTVARHQSLAAAHQVMVEHDVRHLPVLDAGGIVGIISERDLLLLEAMPGVNPPDVRVEEAMVKDVFTVPPDAPVGEAIETMIRGKLGSAIVCEAGRVVGVFTTVDALRALHELLERR